MRTKISSLNVPSQKRSFQIPFAQAFLLATLSPLVPSAESALIIVSSCPSLRFGFVQDKYSASAFNFPAENKPQYIHVTGETLWAKRGQVGPCGRSVSRGRGLATSTGVLPSHQACGRRAAPADLRRPPGGCHTGPLLPPQEQCSCSCPTPSASSRGSSGDGATPPVPPTKTCFARSGSATTGPTTPC